MVNSLYHGCDGGWDGLDYAKTTGLVSEEVLPYIAKEMKVDPIKNNYGNRFHTKGVVKVTKSNPEAMKAAVAKNAVWIVVVAKGKFPSYKRGIMNTCMNGDRINHAVVMAGYGSEGG
jgi:hypothetical protein